MTKEVLHIGLQDSKGTRVLRLSGELDLYTCDRLMKISREWIYGGKKVVMNLDDLKYIDSAGLSTLVWMWVEARDRGSKFSVTCNNPRVYRIFEITGLINLFQIDVSPVEVRRVTRPTISDGRLPASAVGRQTPRLNSART